MHVTKTAAFWAFSVAWVPAVTYCRFRVSRASKTAEGIRYRRWTLLLLLAGAAFFLLLPIL
jgi:hypothetical protein